MHSTLSLCDMCMPLFMDSAVGRGCGIPVSFTAGKESGNLSQPGGSLCSPAAGISGLFSRGAEQDNMRSTRGMVRGVKAERSRYPSLAAPLFPRSAPAGGEGWAGQCETTCCTASFSKSWLLRSDKTPSDREFYPVHSRYCFTSSPSSGCGSQKAGAASRGGRVSPPAQREGKEPPRKRDRRAELLTQFSCGRLELALRRCQPGRMENDAPAGKSPCCPSVSRRGSTFTTQPCAWSERHSLPALVLSTPIHKYRAQSLQIPFLAANEFARPNNITPVP